MFNFSNKKRLLMIGGGVVLLVIILWLMFGGKSSNQTDTTLTEIASDPVELIIGREMLVALDKMRTVKLDVSFFNNRVYRSLQDFKVEIPKQPIGRRDPFAPL